MAGDGGQTAPGGGAGAADDAVYGLLSLGGIDVALPLSALREVVSRPEQLTALPVTAAGLVGVWWTVRERTDPAGDGSDVEGRDEPPVF